MTTTTITVPADATETCQMHDDRCDSCDSTNPSNCGAPAVLAMIIHLDGREDRTPFCEDHRETMTIVADALTSA